MSWLSLDPATKQCRGFPPLRQKKAQGRGTGRQCLIAGSIKNMKSICTISRESELLKGGEGL
jgi:hypothetical protein